MYSVEMKQIAWSDAKNRELKANRNRAVCFEDIVAAIEGGGLLDDIEHVNAARYPRQRMFVVLLNDYVYGVPYVTDGDEIFLKTVYPSRKLTLQYLGEDHG
jgi:hypothetical protein